MWESINAQSLVDIGFVLLVTIACARSLFRDSDAAEHRRHAWRRELLELEETLRSLIVEAGSASGRLDRSLLQRKHELENLLKKLDDKEQGQTARMRGEPEFVAQAQASSREAAELPNETWHKPPQRQSQAQASRNTAPQHGKTKRPPVTAERMGRSGLEDLVEAAQDSIALSSAVSKSATAAEKPTGPQTLNEEIEMIKNDPTEGATFSRTSIIDPSTYRIARRLILEGKEIHVVARKLDLPLAEVRNLDRLIRQEGQHTKANATPPEPRPNAAAAARPASAVQPQEDLPRQHYAAQQAGADIEREVTLL